MAELRLLSRLLCSQPNRYGWHAKSSPGSNVPASLIPAPLPQCLSWEVHLTASSLSLLLQFLLFLLSCIEQKCSEACNPASLLPTLVSILLVSRARQTRGWQLQPPSL